MVETTASPPRAVIFGVAGAALTADERCLLSAENPLAIILFARNCESPAAVLRLTAEFRELVGRPNAPILIDQEGGRVARLKPPCWRDVPAPAFFARMAKKNQKAACEAAWLNARILAHELSELGITVDTLPVLDIPQPGADPVIGDRAAGPDPDTATLLGRRTCHGLLAGGVMPVIKHIPGHGRAEVDSHKALPIVNASLEDLTRVDFAPFIGLADAPWGMTAHVVYTAIDGANPATTSRTVVRDIIRERIGFAGLLLSDDICMNALGGFASERAQASLSAGCDVVLHCNGDLSEMRAVAEVCPPLSAEAQVRLEKGERAMLAAHVPDECFACDEAVARLAAIIESFQSGQGAEH